MDLALIKPNYECLDVQKWDCRVIADLTREYMLVSLYSVSSMSTFIIKYNLVCTKLSHNVSMVQNEL